MAHDVDAAWSRMAAITNMTARVLRSASMLPTRRMDVAAARIRCFSDAVRCIVPEVAIVALACAAHGGGMACPDENESIPCLQELCDVHAALYFCVEASVAACCHLSEL